VIEANTLVPGTSYTFPETVDLGLIKSSELKSNPVDEFINQTLMDYQEVARISSTAQTISTSEARRSALGAR